MADQITADHLSNNVVEPSDDHEHPKQKSHVNFPSDDHKMDSSVKSNASKAFGRQKSVHIMLGAGKSADVLLWRNKKISGSVLAIATGVWLLFEWLNYHLLTIVCFVLALGMGAQFAWSNASGFLTRSPFEIPRVQLPESIFVNIAIAIAAEVNRALAFLQDVARSGNMRQFIMVISCLWFAAVIGSWCNFLTVIYLGFVAAHTLPVLYEKHKEEIDHFVDNLIGQLHQNYQKLDARVLSKMPTRKYAHERKQE